MQLSGRRQESRTALEEALRLHERKGNLPAAATIRRRLEELSRLD
jgi:hypothetical protein